MVSEFDRLTDAYQAAIALSDRADRELELARIPFVPQGEPDTCTARSILRRRATLAERRRYAAAISAVRYAICAEEQAHAAWISAAKKD